jgi:long-chain acyl-CoA synthetase
MMQSDFLRVFDLVDYQSAKYPQVHCLNYWHDDKWLGFTTSDVKKRVDFISSWLIENGFEMGQRVALVPRQGSAQWMMLDFACQQVGLVIVPIHPTAPADESAFIIQETEATLCITADVGLYHKINALANRCPSLKKIYHLEIDEEGYLPALQVKTIRSETSEKAVRIKGKIKPEDLLAIVYTSGTSGQPKGAMLTHYNVVSNIKSVLPILPLEAGQRVLSFLPFSHIFERTSCYAYFAFGVCIYFSDNLNQVTNDFKTVQPYFCTTVPKTLERMYDILQEQRLEKNWWKKKWITWAMDIGEHYQDESRSGIVYSIKLLFARWFVLYRWRRALGGKMKYMAVGAAALRPEISRLFSSAGVVTLAGYGMTEASPYISVNRPGYHKFGTVGLPVPSVEIKLGEQNEQGEGEILVKGPNIMQGYYKRPELNEQLFTPDGWLRTGDIGKMVYKHFLTITDRKKDIFKTTAGIYIAPQPLENHFNKSPFIQQCLVVGFNKPFVSAVLVPNFQMLKNWCDEYNIHWTSPTYMIHNIKVIGKMQVEVDSLNETLENFKRVKKFVLSDTEWTTENGDLTASFKMVRSKLVEKHRVEIEKLYST